MRDNGYMKDCESVTKIMYELYLESLKKGLKVKDAMWDAYKQGAPRVFYDYTRLRRQISCKYRTGKYDLKADYCKTLVIFLDEIYRRWLNLIKLNSAENKQNKYLYLLEIMEQPIMWSFSFHVFKKRLYKYMQGKYKGKHDYIF